MKTLTECLETGVRSVPDRPLFTFLDRALRPVGAYTWRGFHHRTNGLARVLVDDLGVEAGEPILLVYPPGLEMIAAFVACVKIGAVPVPVPPPAGSTSAVAAERLTLICGDAGAKRGLTDSSLLAGLAEVDAVSWADTTGLRQPLAHFESRERELLFLQYTSGSTQAPRGVMVTHSNVLANSALLDHTPVTVSWLPHFHDLGLIGSYLFPLIRGGSAVHFSPADFLRRPLSWLEAISRFGATSTAAPNFAFEYCLRPDKISDEEIATLNLSTMRLMINGSEPVRLHTMERFLARFGPAGLPPESLVACYGLAENTLCVSSRGRVHVRVSHTLLERHELRIVRDCSSDHNTVALASCGRPMSGVDVRIVNAEQRREAASGEIGEIWIGGRSKARGYWNHPELTDEIFHARLQDEPGEARFLRTGDIGFFDEGELYVCGRVKDMITVRGLNVYPSDVEAIVERSLATPARVVVFGSGRIAQEDEGLVILMESRPGDPRPDLLAVYRKVRTHLHVPILAMACVAKGSLATTSSGKISRSRSRVRWRAGSMRELGRFAPPAMDPGGVCVADKVQELLDLAGGAGDLTIEDLGLDSLELVTLSLALEEFLRNTPGAAALADEVFDLRTLQSVTIGNLRRIVNDPDAVSNNGPGLAVLYRRAALSAAEHDGWAMRADAVLSPDTRPGAGRSWPLGRREGVVVLTGATGFLGAHLLDALLRLTSQKVVVVARGMNDSHARRRVAVALERLQDAATAELDARVEVLVGDIAAPRLGLSSPDWQSLAERADAVIHSGAHVDYVKTYSDLRRANVSSTREVISLCCSGRPKTLHHISTTFVFGWGTAPTMSEEDFNPAMEGLDFGYPQSKWVAEQLVAGAQGRGLDARIYRPAFVTASRRGQYVREDILVRVFSYMIRHGLSVDAANQLSMLPVDVCAQNIVALAALEDPGARVFHLTADRYCTMQMACECITERYGYRFEYVGIDAMVEHMKRFCGPDDVLFPLVAFVRNNSRKIAAMGGKRYDSRNYRMARARATQTMHEPDLADSMAWIVEFLRQQHLIPADPRRVVWAGSEMMAEEGVR